MIHNKRYCHTTLQDNSQGMLSLIMYVRVDTFKEYTEIKNILEYHGICGSLNILKTALAVELFIEGTVFEPKLSETQKDALNTIIASYGSALSAE